MQHVCPAPQRKTSNKTTRSERIPLPQSGWFRTLLILGCMIFTRAHLEGILAANWPAAARLVGWARALAGAGAETLPKALVLEIRRILRPAESLIRRLVVIMAARIEISVPSASTGTSPAKPRQSAEDRAASQGETPAHRLCALSPAEPFPVSFSISRRRGPPACPGFWMPGMTRYVPPEPEVNPLVSAASLFARLGKLEAVLADPEMQARRVALWMARRRADTLRTRSVRTIPLRPWGLMPGASSDALDALTRSRILYTAQAAQAALFDGAWNTS